MDNEIRKYCEQCKFYSVLGCQSTLICNNGNKFLAANVQPVDRWISVDDALPIYDGLVLAVDKNNTVRLCVYTELGWLSQYGNPLVAHITHWQPIPEPPKDGDNNA